MNVYDIIARKRDGGELNGEEISFFIKGVTDGSIPDYQASAWLMAVFLRGMSGREMLDLTLAMRDSGDQIDLSDLPGRPTVDKHSTGGVGDKTTLLVVPILAAAGVPVLKMSGRGLGFSGGTVDKLEAIPGLRVDLTIEQAKAQVRQVGAALLAQTGNLAPADKILYGLRDVTATVESIPLIAGSIMSKKLAAGAERIVLDVKVGRGAFMKTREQAELLAKILVGVGVGAGVPTVAILSRMDEPLGMAVGNALEIKEVVSFLQFGRPGKRDSLLPDEIPFVDLCLELAAVGLMAAGKARTNVEAKKQAVKLLSSGAAGAKFAEIIAAQGGPKTLDELDASLPVAPVQHIVTADESGTVDSIDAERVGRLAMQLGAGRATKKDTIDPSVGIVLSCKTGATVHKGDPIATLHLRAEDASRTDALAETLREAFQIIPSQEASQRAGSLVLTHIP
jgi:pyrimidine-nucleoside phosphorylase